MRPRIVNLGRDYPGKIYDFSEARNSFLRTLPDNEWILFIDDDAEASQMLLSYLHNFSPPEDARYYTIRTINLVNGKYSALTNPFFWRVLVSNKVRYVGKLHEKIIEEPTGMIDYPIIHNHQGPTKYASPRNAPFFTLRLAVKKLKDILLKGRYDGRVW